VMISDTITPFGLNYKQDFLTAIELLHLLK
jgi:hypothetical protein